MTSAPTFTTDIVVISTDQQVFDSFLKSISKTDGWEEIRLHVIHRGGLKVPVDGKKILEYPSLILGNKVSNEILRWVLAEKQPKSSDKNIGYFGIFNDDLLFLPNWYAEVKKVLEYEWCVSPGYIESDSVRALQCAYERTKSHHTNVPLIQGACALFRLESVFYIGMLDPQFTWGCDDLDLAWRFHLADKESVTMKKVTVAHAVGTSRSKNMKAWNIASQKSKALFYDKHGIFAYRTLNEMYFNSNGRNGTYRINNEENVSHRYFKWITEQTK